MSNYDTTHGLALVEAANEAMEGVTEGPWRWEINLKSKLVELAGGNPKAGFGSYDLTVMDFKRWGVNGAAPRFLDAEHLLCRADELAKIVNGREHHSAWFQTINHPDADFIAYSRQGVPALAADHKLAIEEIVRLRAEREDMIEGLVKIEHSAMQEKKGMWLRAQVDAIRRIAHNHLTRVGIETLANDDPRRALLATAASGEGE